MNKDVIYIEPEDDITDIINRLKASSQKVVALVPPKKLGVLRSVVNNKLIAKTAKESDKVAVIVTTDAALLKMAASAGLPVAKTLQSRPIMPGEIAPEILAKSRNDEVIEEGDSSDNNTDKTSKSEETKKSPTSKASEKSEDEKAIEESDDNNQKKSAKDSKSDKNKKIPALEKYRKRIIIGAAAGVLLIIFLIWALIFAPAAKIIVSIKTTPGNFSENVTCGIGACVDFFRLVITVPYC